MPILYKNTQNNIIMKQLTEMTQEEALLIISYQPMYSFTLKQAAELVNLVKLYIDPLQQSCAACGSSLRESKNKIINFYNINKLTIDNVATNTIIIKDIINQEVKEKQKKNKKK